jgi:hypothetical protein
MKYNGSYVVSLYTNFKLVRRCCVHAGVSCALMVGAGWKIYINVIIVAFRSLLSAQLGMEPG